LEFCEHSSPLEFRPRWITSLKEPESVSPFIVIFKSKWDHGSMQRRFLVLVSCLQICLLTLTSNNSYADSVLPIILRVQYTTIENPIVYTSNSNSEVNFTAYIRVQNYNLTDGDLVCSLFNQVNATIRKINEGQYAATCTFKFDAQTPTGLQFMFMREKQELIGNQQKFRLIPDNARSIYSSIGKDSFGQPVESSIFGYEIFSQGAMFVQAPVAINPPSSYLFPAFPKESNAFIIFDVRGALSQNLKTTLDSKRKILTVECPTTILPKRTPATTGKTSRTILVFKYWGSRYLADQETKFKIEYLSSDFRGKKLNLSCSYLVGLKDSIYQNLPLTYVESNSKMISFPKK